MGTCGRSAPPPVFLLNQSLDVIIHLFIAKGLIHTINCRNHSVNDLNSALLASPVHSLPTKIRLFRYYRQRESSLRRAYFTRLKGRKGSVSVRKEEHCASATR